MSRPPEPPELILYTRQAQAYGIGRGGTIKMSGLRMYSRLTGRDEPVVSINPLTSKGKVSYNCLVEVPLADVPALIAVLRGFLDHHAEPPEGPDG